MRSARRSPWMINSAINRNSATCCSLRARGRFTFAARDDVNASGSGSATLECGTDRRTQVTGEVAQGTSFGSILLKNPTTAPSRTRRRCSPSGVGQSAGRAWDGSAPALGGARGAQWQREPKDWKSLKSSPSRSQRSFPLRSRGVGNLRAVPKHGPHIRLVRPLK